MEFRASRWGGLMSWTKLLMPDTIIISDSRLTVVKRSFLGLKNTTEEMNYARIASVRVKNGFFFSDVIIETTGGATSDIYIKTLKKKTAKHAADAIKGKAV